MIGQPTSVGAPIVVFVHVYYPDIWCDMSRLLAERLPLPFRLVLTSPRPQTELVLPQTSNMLSTSFLRMENRGRDILPFLQALAETDGFDIGLKLHTKKSPQRDDGASWRAEVLESLLPPSPTVRGIVAGMHADGRIGIVSPAGFCLSVRPAMNMNLPGMQRVMSTIGTSLTDNDLDDCFFAAGSMFWFRRSALAPLIDPRLPTIFEDEMGQLDGTIPHAMERVFPIAARQQGYFSLAVPALTASRPEMRLSELRELAQRHVDVPSSYFPQPVPPPPLVTAAPVPSRRWDFAKSVYRACLPEWIRYSLRLILSRKRPPAPNARTEPNVG
jgi:lipopolysaccharide biosynthesis protein